MKKSLQILGLSAASTLMFTLAAHATTYNGNGAGGFGGPIGNSSLTVTNDSAGMLTFTITTPAGGFGNEVAFYFDSTSGGFNSTSTFTDNGDEGRQTLSGVPSATAASAGNVQSVVTFPTGFGADYGVALDDAGNGNLFLLNAGTAFTYLQGANYTITGSNTVFTFSFNATALGLTVANGSSFSFVANLLNANDSGNGGIYRSNESYGTNTSAGNPGDGPITFTTSDTYTLSGVPTGVPEPSTYATALLFIGVLGGASILRRSRV